MNSKNNTIEKIVELCANHNTNITTLCIEITGSSGNLATWNKGNIRNDYLIEIAKRFNVSTDYLLGLDAQNSPVSDLSKEDRELLELYHKLNTRGKLKALDYIADLTENSKYSEEYSVEFYTREA